eukprot:1307605-Prymnesium_polylepis.1
MELPTEGTTALEFADEKLRADREVVLVAVSSCWFALQFASDELRNDETIVLQVVRCHGWALQFASEKQRANKMVVLEAVRCHGWALQFASDELRANKTVVLEAVHANCAALRFASPELQVDPQLWLLATARVDADQLTRGAKVEVVFPWGEDVWEKINDDGTTQHNVDEIEERFQSQMAIVERVGSTNARVRLDCEATEYLCVDFLNLRIIGDAMETNSGGGDGDGGDSGGDG